ncbi:hypothetical protein OFC13_26550, partial [Escherichia coli]|nr:hypothetical protein [Escherichia coli]
LLLLLLILLIILILTGRLLPPPLYLLLLLLILEAATALLPSIFRTSLNSGLVIVAFLNDIVRAYLPIFLILKL